MVVGRALVAKPRDRSLKALQLPGRMSLSRYEKKSLVEAFVLSGLFDLAAVGVFRLQQQLWHPCRRPCKSSFLERALATA